MGKDQDLLDAARTGNVACIERLLAGRLRKSSGGSITSALASIISLKGVNINCTDATGATPLHLAALNGHRDAVLTLLQNEASINAQDTRNCTALHLAAWNGHHDICNTLLQPWPTPALVNMQNCDGDTPLHCAAQHGHSPTVSVLLQNKADPTIRNLEEYSAMDLASQYGRLEVVQQLATVSPSLLSQNLPSHSPLHLAARYGHKAIVECLLQLRFPVNLKTDNGTALHEAATYCKLNVIKCLLDHGINVNETNKKGETAEQILKTFPAHKAEEALNLIAAANKPPERPQRSASSSPMPNRVSRVERRRTDSGNSQEGEPAPPLPPRVSIRRPVPINPVPTGPKVPVPEGTPPQGGLAFIGTAVEPKAPFPRKPPRKKAPESRHSQDSLATSVDLEPRESHSKSESPGSATSLGVESSIMEATPDSDPGEGDSMTSSLQDHAAKRKSWSKQRASGVDLSPKSPDDRELAEKLAQVKAKQMMEEAPQPGSSSTSPNVFPPKVNIPKETVITLTHTKEIEAKTNSRPSSMSNGDVNHISPKASPAEHSREVEVGPGEGPSPVQSEGQKASAGVSQDPAVAEPKSASPRKSQMGTLEKKQEKRVSAVREGLEKQAEFARDGSGDSLDKAEKPRSLDFRQSISSTGDIPLSPTGYVQPPTPDYPPPSPSTAAQDIKQKINPLEKRRSKDMETLTDAALFQAGGLENIPEKVSGNQNGETSPPDQNPRNSGPSQEVRMKLENILDTSCVGLEPVLEERQPSPQEESGGDQAGQETTTQTETGQGQKDELAEPAVMRQISSGSEADIERDLYAGLLRGSTPGGSRDVVSQLIIDNIHGDLRPGRHRPHTTIIPETLMDRGEFARTSSTDHQQQQQQQQQSQEQQAAQQQKQQQFSSSSRSGSTATEKGASMPCNAVGDAVVMRDKKSSTGEEVFDMNEEWEQVAALLASIGSGLVRESVFVRDFEPEFTRTLTGTHRIQSVGDWLETFGLGQYENTLVANGFDDTDFLGGKIIEDADLQAIGITNEEHRKKILAAAESLPAVQPIGKDNMPLSVEVWLESLRLEHYWDTFRSHECNTMARVANLWELELTTVLDITSIGHKKRILASLGDRKPPDRNQTLPKPRAGEVLEEVSKSPFEDINLYKDYTGVRSMAPHEDDRSSSSTGAEEGSDQPSQKGDDTIYIRSPHQAHMAPIKQWRHRPDTLIKGCCKYTAQYLGSTLVRELKGPESTQEGIAKLKEDRFDKPQRLRRKLQKSADVIVKIPTIMLSISYKGVKFIDARSKRVICDHEIANIFCVCQDSEHLNFFAYITKDRETGKHFCHVFSARSREHAGEIILTLGEAFEIAYQLALKERALEVDDTELHNSSDPDDQTSLSSKNSTAV